MRISARRTTTLLCLTFGVAAGGGVSRAAQSVLDKLKQVQKQQQQRPAPPARPGQQPQTAGAANESGPVTPPPGTKIEPVVMAPLQDGAMVAISPHGIHVATATSSGSRQVILYDGVAGPKFDRLINPAPIPVIFSPDGNRYVYCAQSGNEWVVMVDGKELARASAAQIGAMSCSPGFSPNGKHVYFTSVQDNPSPSAPFRFFWDAKPSPFGASVDLRGYAFSPDGEHVAYMWSDPTVRTPPLKLFVDNQPSPFDGGAPLWSPDSKHLYTTRIIPAPGSRRGSVQEILFDGKPAMRVDFARLYMPPAGDMGIALVQKGDAGEFLVVGGKMVPGSENPGTGRIKEITFSPDGKHYAAVYADTNGRTWVFSDGKRGQTYDSLDRFRTTSSENTMDYGSVHFTADSSALVYVANNGGKYYVVYNGEESDAVPMVSDCVFSPVKNHVAIAHAGVLTLDGKIVRLPNPHIIGITQMGFSPDGDHFAAVLGDSTGKWMYLDGVLQTAYRPTGGGPMKNIATRPFVFSPDSKHIAYFCYHNDTSGSTDAYLCVDDKAARVGQLGNNLTFSGDSNHLFWRKDGPLTSFRVMADGKPVLEALKATVNSQFGMETWQLAPDGNLLLLAQDETSLQRLHIVPGPDSSVAQMVGGPTSLPSKH